MRRAVGAVAWLVAVCGAQPPQRNVIHIISDDMRPEIGAYGVLDRHTPNLDKLAAEGTIFTRAFAQQAVCGPSRNSFMRWACMRACVPACLRACVPTYPLTVLSFVPLYSFLLPAPT